MDLKEKMRKYLLRSPPRSVIIQTLDFQIFILSQSNLHNGIYTHAKPMLIDNEFVERRYRTVD